MPKFSRMLTAIIDIELCLRLLSLLGVGLLDTKTKYDDPEKEPQKPTEKA